jgi:D-glycero-D-manno-heptose 1,7-bisphosphate phosphatase
MSEAAVFLDRDGTIIEEVGYLDSPDRLTVFPWSPEAIRLLNEAGLRVVVITNQAGVARGLFSEQTVAAIHDELSARLARASAHVDAYYYCPHHPAGSVEAYACVCRCRKPAPALVERAAADLDIDPARSFVVGDRWLDVSLARNVGARSVLVRTGYGRDEERQPIDDVAADAVVDDLLAAARWILHAIDGVAEAPCS